MRPWRNRRFMVVLLLLIWIFVSIIWYAIVNNKHVHIYDEPSEVLWWSSDISWDYDETRLCGFKKCRFTNNRKRLNLAHTILFYGSNMKFHDFPLPRNEIQLWALLHEESPRNVPFVPYTTFMQHFNYTSTFSRYSNMPLTTQYLPHINDLSSLEFFLPFHRKEIVSFNNKLSPVAFLQTDCETMSGREDYVRELMKHINVDSYGKCLHNTDMPKYLQKDYLNNLFSPNLLRFFSRYKFMIAIENGVCDDYITEKYWRPLVMGVIPIYFGSPSIRDWQPHNKSAIYVDDFPNAAALAAYLHELANNGTAYNAYLNHKLKRQQTIDNPLLLSTLLTRSYSMAENSMFNKFECHVCTAMSAQTLSAKPLRQTTDRQYSCPLPPVQVPLQPGKVPKYGVDWQSVMAMGRCQAKLIDRFLRANRKYTEKEFLEQLDKLVQDHQCD